MSMNYSSKQNLLNRLRVQNLLVESNDLVVVGVFNDRKLYQVFLTLVRNIRINIIIQRE